MSLRLLYPSLSDFIPLLTDQSNVHRNSCLSRAGSQCTALTGTEFLGDKTLVLFQFYKGLGTALHNPITPFRRYTVPRCGEEEETPEHIVFRCGKIRRVKDEKGRREWAIENGDSWDALASQSG